MSAKVQTLDLDVQGYMKEVGERAKAAARETGRAESRVKNTALLAIAEAIDHSTDRLLVENRKDIVSGEQHGLDAALLDRHGREFQIHAPVKNGNSDDVAQSDPETLSDEPRPCHPERREGSLPICCFEVNGRMDPSLRRVRSG